MEMYVMRNLLNRCADIFAQRIGLTRSQLFPSPAKFFLLRHLQECLRETAGMSIGMDVACADFKYRSLFRTDRYVGVDLSPENLARGVSLNARTGDVDVLANLLELKHCPGVADVVVSTHTLASLPRDLSLDGVLALMTAVADNGSLFFNIPKDFDNEEINNILESSFGSVTRKVYANPLFMKIENFFAHRTGGKSSISLSIIGFFALVAYAFSYIENVPYFGRNGYYVIYKCNNKKSNHIDKRISEVRSIDMRNFE